MSSLQLGLVIVGALVLAAVAAHSAWIARKKAPRQAQPGARASQEPQLDSLSDPIGAAERSEPGFDPLDSRFPPEKRLALDQLIDVIAPIELESVVSGDAALAALPSTRRAGGKPFAIEGHNELTHSWELPLAGQRYQAFQAGVQLANRTGALNQLEYSEFVIKVQAFADAINGNPDFPDMLDAVGRARELDQFASEHDAQLSFTLRTQSAAWSPGYIQQHAARMGFAAGGLPGRMVLPAAAEGAPALLQLSFDTLAALSDNPAQSAIERFTLSLDVPHVDRYEQAFGQLRSTALALAQSMDGAITDDHGQRLSTSAMDVIGQDLELLYDKLDAHDLSAGSAQARRLFS